MFNSLNRKSENLCVFLFYVLTLNTSSLVCLIKVSAVFVHYNIQVFFKYSAHTADILASCRLDAHPSHKSDFLPST